MESLKIYWTETPKIKIRIYFIHCRNDQCEEQSTWYWWQNSELWLRAQRNQKENRRTREDYPAATRWQQKTNPSLIRVREKLEDRTDGMTNRSYGIKFPKYKKSI